MKCEACKGRGFYWHMGIEKLECGVCHGSGEVQTNEEWLRNASTEELAEILYRLCNHASIFGGGTTEEFVEWLKENHNGNT